MQRKVLIAHGIAGILVFAGGLHSAHAQTQVDDPLPRILKTIDDSDRVVLSGGIHPLARAQFDRGAAPWDLQFDHMELVLQRTPKQQIELEALLREQQTPGSSNYHQWVTPEEFGRRFGPAPDDLASLVAWLQARGFHVDEVPSGGGYIDFSGTAGQLQDAFHTAMHRYLVRGQEHWANASDPEIPAAFGDVVAGIVNLNDFFARSHSVRSEVTWPIPTEAEAQPLFSRSGWGNALAPADFATIYNLSPLYAASVNGQGATIAVVGRSNINVQDVADFRRVFDLPANAPHVVVNGPDPGNLGGGEETEAVLDSSWAGAVAPNSKVTLVVSASTATADGTLLSEQYIINNNLADVMTESFGLCEADVAPSYASYLSSLAQQAAAQGITYVVSSGDAGSSGCDNDNLETSATGPLSVNVMGSSPFLTSVGGTQFNEGGGSYWSATNSSTLASALSYIPENVWNQSCTAAHCGGGANIIAGGGGASQYFSKPYWQSGVAGAPNDGARDVPDVAMAASAAHDPYLLCLEGSCRSSSPMLYSVGGTSAAAPAFAGIMALVRQKTGARQGLANTTLYPMSAAEQLAGCNASSSIALPASNCIFNDVTVGNNSVPGGPGNGTGNPRYMAGTGYDLATGLGSVNAANLVNRWGSVSASPTPRLSFSPPYVAFASQRLGTVSPAQEVVITNSGSTTLIINNVAVTNANAHVFRETNTCGSSVRARASCTISLTFTPAATGLVTGSVTVTDNAPGSPHRLQLSGTGLAAPSVGLSRNRLAFGKLAVGASSAGQTVTLTDTGTAALAVTSVAITGANWNQFAVAGTCGSSLNTGASCGLAVTFRPTATGSMTASLIIKDSAVNSPQNITLSGTATSPKALLSPADIVFANQAVGTASSVHGVALSNVGNGTLSLTSIVLGGANPTAFRETNTCGSSLAAGASCQISVTFAPTAGQSASASVTVTDNAPGSPHSVRLSGTGVSSAVVNLSPQSLKFGSRVGFSSLIRRVTLSNKGTAALTLTGVSIVGTNKQLFTQSNNCGKTVKAGSSCTISVRFRPTASGSKSASLTILDNAVGGPQTVALSGTGT